MLLDATMLPFVIAATLAEDVDVTVVVAAAEATAVLCASR